ncbi:ABC transporter permease [Dorea sp. D27]|uniref:ABC transporter permease n=1 Tax=Dorea sp. D27 TaxID=658665 RepID=UPI000673118B|nr:ABC transporter permease [Dorea sp. D27]KMZ54983.1 efflux ABC transporter, permease protein [Dorea sp. D27]
MDIIQILTIRHLKQNKKRTLATAAGIWTATVLLTMLSVFLTSFMQKLEAADVAREDVKPLLSAASGMMAVVLAVLVIFLYNMLIMSFRDRGRYLGILASVGATPFQRRKIAFMETVILGGAAIPTGIGAGVLLSVLIFPFDTVVSWRVLALIFLCECAAVLLTGIVTIGNPAKRPVIDFIRNVTDKRSFKKPVMLPGWMERFFRTEGKLALKNIIFFKRRYIITGISFIISMLLFLDGYIYLNYLDGRYEARDRRPKDNADMVLEEAYNKRNDAWEDFTAEAVTLPGIEEYSIQERADMGTVLFEAKDINPKLKEYRSYILGTSYKNPITIGGIEGETQHGYAMNLVVIGMDEDGFRAYLDKAGVSGPGDVGDGKIPVLIEDYPVVKTGGTTRYRSVLSEQVKGLLSVYSDAGQWMYPEDVSYGKQVDEFVKWEFQVLGVTTETAPCYVDSPVEEPNTIYFYTTQQALERLVKNKDFPKDGSGTYRRLAIKVKSKAPELPDNVLFPAVVQRGNTIYRSLKLAASSYAFLSNDTTWNALQTRERETAKMQEETAKIGEKYGLSDGGGMDIDNFDWSQVDYTCDSYPAQIMGALTEPFPLLRHLFVYGVLIFLTVISVFQMIKIITSAAQMRRREFAVLLSVGMSRRQIAKMLYLENLICTAGAYVAGLAASVSLAFVLFQSWGKEQAVEPMFPYQIIVMETVAFLLLILLSVYLSFRNVKKIQLIDIIKEETV